jgi:hypothetical protein
MRGFFRMTFRARPKQLLDLPRSNNVEVSMKSKKTVVAALVVLGFTATLLVFPLLASSHATPKNIDVSQLSNNESEETIAVNPTNPNNIVIVTNVVVPAAGLFAAVSFDGGSTWTQRIVGNNDNLGAACCDPSLSFDEFGNLFLLIFSMLATPCRSRSAPTAG